ncbi:hypothetical protein PTKU64_80450 [Paraburkholderia terrae]|uniref:Class I SAM-dependent methyltransferase n=1 Tax=Paraburkholderia terrae TaxID=311230 RepID=A0ABM7TZQ9_9BURK|nr:class I SAM-dependent methyltransferase [Paraburkholderia terrae]BCZ84370.1 hypothetical protein PTKU64_80450 [Paraburkholderia terrae]
MGTADHLVSRGVSASAHVPIRDEIAIQFTHGLGDCAWFALQLPLYVRRGYRFRLACSADKHIVFAGSGVELTADASGTLFVPWHEGLQPTAEADWNNAWRWNKGARNFSVSPMPDIGTPKDLWDEYRAERVNLLPHLPVASCRAAGDWLHALARPVVLVHTHGNTGPERKNLDAVQCRRLYFRLLEETDGTIVLLDWDNRVPRLAHWRVRHLADDWKNIDTSTLFALMAQSDLLIGVDSGPLHAARLVDMPAIGVWTRGGSPLTWSLPRPRQLNVVIARDRPVWAARARIAYHIVEINDGESGIDQLATLAGSMLAGPHFLKAPHAGADAQLQWFVRQRLRGGASPLGGYVDRHRSFDLLLSQLAERFVQPQVVETGCIRAEDDFAGAGFSTYVLGAYLHARGGHLVSVDVDPNHCAFARQWTCCFGDTVEVCTADSVAWLASSRERIDLLYLDSLDANDPHAGEHGLAEIEAAYPRLHGRSLVACDDTVYQANAFHGKGALVVPWLIERGWRVIYSGHQTVLSM